MKTRKYIFSAIVIVLFFTALFRPNNSFDGIFYTGCIISFEDSNPEIVHSKTFSLLKDFTTAEEYDSLRNQSAYQKAQFEDIRSFYEQLPFYKSRILYLAFIYLGYKAGVNPFLWGHIFSVICIITGLLILLIKFDIYKSLTRSVVFLLASLITGCGYASRMFYPDSMVFTFVCLLFYFACSNQFGKLFLSAPLLVLIKPALFLYVFLMLIFAYYYFKTGRSESQKKYYFASLFAATLFYILLQVYYSGFGLNTYFYHSFIERLNYPLSFTGTVSFTDYINVLTDKSVALTNNKPFLFFLLTSAVVIYYTRLSIKNSFQLFFASANLLFVFIQFIVFPDIDERFFIGQYMASFTLLLFSVNALKNIPANTGD